MILRLRYKKLGGHYHCRLFTAERAGMTFAKSGDLVFRESEWEALLWAWNGSVEFLKDVESCGHAWLEEGCPICRAKFEHQLIEGAR